MILENLLIKSRAKVARVNTDFVRYLAAEIAWQNRLLGIKGARGTGKTTLVLQYMKNNLSGIPGAMYISLDDLYFSANSLYDLADRFVKFGGTHLFLDEVHRYPSWAQEIKLLYDDFPDLKMVFTGSSILELTESKADLSRRVIMYHLQGLSFREFLNFTLGTSFSQYSLETLLQSHENIAMEVCSKIKILPLFGKYLEYGYYPYFREDEPSYQHRIGNVVNMILENDLLQIKGLSPESVSKLKKMLYIISNSVPFKPNISKLSELTGIGRNTLVMYLNYLEDAAVINLLHTDISGIGYLRKPEKIYLENPNLNFALASDRPEAGNIRETFFLNQMRNAHHVTFGETGDFIIDNRWTFEVGGKNKKGKQISHTIDSFIVTDQVEHGLGKRIPLWLFGFIY